MLAYHLAFVKHADFDVARISKVAVIAIAVLRVFGCGTIRLFVLVN